MIPRDRWADLTLDLKQALYDRLRGKGVGVIKATLITVDGELVCWSDVNIQSMGPFTATRPLANFLAGIEEEKTDDLTK